MKKFALIFAVLATALFATSCQSKHEKAERLIEDFEDDPASLSDEDWVAVLDLVEDYCEEYTARVEDILDISDRRDRREAFEDMLEEEGFEDLSLLYVMYEFASDEELLPAKAEKRLSKIERSMEKLSDKLERLSEKTEVEMPKGLRTRLEHFRENMYRNYKRENRDNDYADSDTCVVVAYEAPVEEAVVDSDVDAVVVEEAAAVEAPVEYYDYGADTARI